jgi:periplasmic copper chaperone A
VLTGLRVGVALLAGITAVQAQGNASVTVSDAWARATPPHAATGAAYLTLTSPAADTLVGVSSPVAAEAELHSMTMEGNVMHMRPVEGGLDLPAGKPVTLAPGGTHVMLMGLRAPLKQGQGVMLHLTFRNAPPEDVTARVEALGAKGPPAGGSGQGSMAGMPMH